MTELQSEVSSKFSALFGGEPIVIRSPGRINLIGEHTDYNNGFVMPAAIDKEAVFAIAPSTNGTSTVYSLSYDEKVSINLEDPIRVDKPKWANYLLGVVYQFIHHGHAIAPFNCVFGGNIPVGAGLSSSAAIECGFGFALNEMNNLNLPKIQIIRMAQWSEHHYVGVKCGIMDQFASVMGKDDHVILLDCQSMAHRYYPMDLKEYTIMLCDTRVKHSLVDTEYNRRREECDRGVTILMNHYPEIRSLRDATEEIVRRHENEFPDRIFQRCLYVVQEIERVRQAAKDLETGNLRSFGMRMYQTHEGLSSLYEVSCPELDFLVDQARKYPEVIGARMMGGGFGGCTINLVTKNFAESFRQTIIDAYHTRFAIQLPVYEVQIEDGTSVVSPDVSVVK